MYEVTITFSDFSLISNLFISTPPENYFSKLYPSSCIFDDFMMNYIFSNLCNIFSLNQTYIPVNVNLSKKEIVEYIYVLSYPYRRLNM